MDSGLPRTANHAQFPLGVSRPPPHPFSNQIRSAQQVAHRPRLHRVFVQLRYVTATAVKLPLVNHMKLDDATVWRASPETDPSSLLQALAPQD